MSRFRLILVGALAVFAFSALASASAFAAPHYYSGSTRLTEGAELLITGLGGKQTLKSTAAGVTIEVNCGHFDVHGHVVNPAGGGAGTSLEIWLYLECAIAGAGTTGCEIPAHMMTINVTSKLLTSSSIIFEPDSSANFVELQFINCSQTGLNNTYPFTGSLLGIISGSTVTINEPKAGGMFKFAGNGASLSSGAVTVEMEGGGGIVVKEP